VAEPLVQRQGIDRIVVQLPGVQDPTELDKILTATATVEFRLVDQSGNQPGSRRYPGRGAEPAQVLKREVIASGDEIVNASAGFSAEGQPAVNITLDAAGGERMLATTRDNLNKPMSTVFIEWREEEITRGGNTETRRVKSEEIINTATIRGVFKNNFQITGLNPIEASDLAKLLRAGALAAPVYKVDDRTIGPTLGQDNIDRGFRAIQIGFLAVIVFMVVYYRVFGLIANVALFSNLIFIVAVLSLLGASLTLPGIAGAAAGHSFWLRQGAFIDRRREYNDADSRDRTARFRNRADQGICDHIDDRHPDVDVHGNCWHPDHRQPGIWRA
jgi:preprotein translocase subunit SecD